MTESRSLAVLAGVQTLRKRRSSLREPASGPRRSGAPPCGQDGSVTAPFWSTSTVRRRTGAVGADTVTASHPAAERQARHDRRRLIVVALALVTGLGWLIVFSLMTRSQTVVPDVSDEHAARTDRVVAVDDQGQPMTESQDTPPEPRRNAVGFERVLDESLDDLHPGREE